MGQKNEIYQQVGPVEFNGSKVRVLYKSNVGPYYCIIEAPSHASIPLSCNVADKGHYVITSYITGGAIVWYRANVVPGGSLFGFRDLNAFSGA